MAARHICYVCDSADEERERLLSDAAYRVLHEIRKIMARNEDIGFLCVKGVPLSGEQIVRAAGVSLANGVGPIMEELSTAGFVEIKDGKYRSSKMLGLVTLSGIKRKAGEAAAEAKRRACSADCSAPCSADCSANPSPPLSPPPLSPTPPITSTPFSPSPDSLRTLSDAAVDVEEPKPRKWDASCVPIPPAIDTPDFRKAWFDFVAHRNAMRGGRMTQRAAELALVKCARFGAADAIVRLERAIMNGWKGIEFLDERKGNGNGKPNNAKPKSEFDSVEAPAIL